MTTLASDGAVPGSDVVPETTCRPDVARMRRLRWKSSSVRRRPSQSIPEGPGPDPAHEMSPRNEPTIEVGMALHARSSPRGACRTTPGSTRRSHPARPSRPTRDTKRPGRPPPRQTPRSSLPRSGKRGRARKKRRVLALDQRAAEARRSRTGALRLPSVATAGLDPGRGEDACRGHQPDQEQDRESQTRPR